MVVKIPNVDGKLTVDVVAVRIPKDRHFRLEKFQLISEDSSQFHINRIQKASIHIDRLLLAIYLCFNYQEVAFEKKSERCWGQLATFINTAGFGDTRSRWVDEVLGKHTLPLLFVDSRARDHPKQRLIVFNEDNINIEKSSIAIVDQHGQPLNDNLCLSEFQSVLGNELTADFKQKAHERVDHQYMSRLASELQLPHLSATQKRVVGKTVWMSRLVGYVDLLKEKLMGGDSILSRLESFVEAYHQNLVTKDDVETTWVELVAFHRFFKTKYFREAADKVGLSFTEFDDAISNLEKHFARGTDELDPIKAMEVIKNSRSCVEETLDNVNTAIGECRKTLSDIIQTDGE